MFDSDGEDDEEEDGNLLISSVEVLADQGLPYW